MKHVFVINPGAGESDATSRIHAMLESCGSALDYEIYRTRSAGDATAYVRSWLSEHGGAVRFYACGGDGTINEVASGMAGCHDAELACYPSGSGNDYIKCFGSRDDFLNLPRLINGTTRRVDLMRVEISPDLQDGATNIMTRYCINICNFGFDAEVCRVMNAVRRVPLIGGRNAYTTGILKSIFTSRRTRCRISVDGEAFHDGPMLLCTIANGRYVGGQYQCAPMSQYDDGVLELNLFRPLSLARFASLLGDYKSGAYAGRTDLDDIWRHQRGTAVVIEADKPFYVCLDGEMVYGQCYRIENLRQAINFVLPACQA